MSELGYEDDVPQDAIEDQIKEWRLDDSQGYAEAIQLICDAEDELRLLRAGVAAETDRCVAILKAARAGDIDADLRCLIFRVESGAEEIKS